jgi:hypothetical protein
MASGGAVVRSLCTGDHGRKKPAFTRLNDMTNARVNLCREAAGWPVRREHKATPSPFVTRESRAMGWCVLLTHAAGRFFGRI